MLQSKAGKPAIGGELSRIATQALPRLFVVLIELFRTKE